MRVDLEKFHNMEFLSVSSLNRYINYKFDSDIHLQEVYLRGEISNFKISGRHAYFSLKDEYSVISAMIFNYQMLNIDFPMEDGIIVQVVGTIKVYEKGSNTKDRYVACAMASHFIDLLEQDLVSDSDDYQFTTFIN